MEFWIVLSVIVTALAALWIAGRPKQSQRINISLIPKHIISGTFRLTIVIGALWIVAASCVVITGPFNDLKELCYLNNPEPEPGTTLFADDGIIRGIGNSTSGDVARYMSSQGCNIRQSASGLKTNQWSDGRTYSKDGIKTSVWLWWFSIVLLVPFGIAFLGFAGLAGYFFVRKGYEK